MITEIMVDVAGMRFVHFIDLGFSCVGNGTVWVDVWAVFQSRTTSVNSGNTPVRQHMVVPAHTSLSVNSFIEGHPPPSQQPKGEQQQIQSNLTYCIS